tara:strand:+ start:50 stop:595 length:546 start_codon:yes stop_codon:yes gene_type:complete
MLMKGKFNLLNFSDNAQAIRGLEDIQGRLSSEVNATLASNFFKPRVPNRDHIFKRGQSQSPIVAIDPFNICSTRDGKRISSSVLVAWQAILAVCFQKFASTEAFKRGADVKQTEIKIKDLISEERLIAVRGTTAAPDLVGTNKPDNIWYRILRGSRSTDTTAGLLSAFFSLISMYGMAGVE